MTVLKRIRLNQKYILRWFLLICLDFLSIFLAGCLALIIRFDFSVTKVEPTFIHSFELLLFPSLFLTVLMFSFFHLYTSLWRYASIVEVEKIILACIFSGLLQLGLLLIFPQIILPLSFPLLYTFFLIILVIVTRFYYRSLRRILALLRDRQHKKNRDGVLVIGAGTAGTALLRELKKDCRLQIIGLLDDDPGKMHSHIFGLPIYGGIHLVTKIASKKKIKEIIVAIPSLNSIEQNRILTLCKKTGCLVKILPNANQLIEMEQKINLSMLKEVNMADLSGRKPVDCNFSDINKFIKDKRILITGAGGSIGSELSRQISLYAPSELILVDVYENHLYELQLELTEQYPAIQLITRVINIQDQAEVQRLFNQFHPQLVFHAAAHKHVPLMEDTPQEAVKNNVLGTLNIAKFADQFSCEKMILVSTDKAVRPTNVMGTTKRISELIIQAYGKVSKTEFAAVRFGNVLGSNGSVVPIFQKQIRQGGLLKVTHPEVTRYFMTITEAVNLILQAGVYANAGEVFILDMGEPVRIVELAKNMIQLSGLILGEDIEIAYTGLRPGEKLYEELLTDEKELIRTTHNKIFICQPDLIEIERLLASLNLLFSTANQPNGDIRPLLKKIVPEYSYEPKQQVVKKEKIYSEDIPLASCDNLVLNKN